MPSNRLNKEEVTHIALLCRLGLDPEDIDATRRQLSSILENFRILDQVDVTDIPPTGHSVALENVLRQDETAPPLPKEDVLANAPMREDDYFRVKAVLD